MQKDGRDQVQLPPNCHGGYLQQGMVKIKSNYIQIHMVVTCMQRMVKPNFLQISLTAAPKSAGCWQAYPC